MPYPFRHFPAPRTFAPSYDAGAEDGMPWPSCGPSRPLPSQCGLGTYCLCAVPRDGCVCFNPPHPTPDDLAHLEALNIFIHGKEQPPVNEQPKTKRDTRGNLVPQPAYEGWRPTPSRTRLDILSNLIGTVALITFALWLLFGGR